MGGVSNQAGQSSSLRGLDFSEFYSVYPSLTLNSKGAHSVIDLNYNFVAERFQMDPAITTTSHAFTGSLQAQASKRVQLRLSDTLNTAPDYSTLNVLKGIAPVEGGFQYLFEPQLYKRSNISNSSRLDLDVNLTDRSSLMFGASGSFRRYEEDIVHAGLSDQTRVEGYFGFSHKSGRRTTWNTRYRIWQNDYARYETTRSHSATLGLNSELRPGLTLNLEAGPSYTERNDDLSYMVNASLSRQFRTNRFSAGYAHSASDSTGYGGSSETHTINMTFMQALGRTTSLNFQGSAFRQTGAYDYDGVYGSLSLSQQLGRYWVASAGASYRSYQSYTSKRFYASIGFRLDQQRHETY
jgi:hypothetical protein